MLKVYSHPLSCWQSLQWLDMVKKLALFVHYNYIAPKQ